MSTGRVMQVPYIYLQVKSEVLPGCHSMSSSGHTRRGTDRAVPDCTGRSSEGATSCQKGIILPEGPAHQLTISEKILPVSTQHCLTSVITCGPAARGRHHAP
ncbi:uncharacterized protein LOC135102870 isoform X4 [Scylla paramamosain]|uniref:uncharacterized protein LOC135102870 isoform X4 n=1 Tax=Scylla paramamosain TaxID=85552 RepID=UPI0030837083